MTTRYLGIDLAWSERSGSGVCVLDDSGLILDEDQLPPARLADWVRKWRGDRSILALDGPLVVPPGSAALRPVERELHRRYGRYHAGPFPGGAASISMQGRDRSPALTLVDDVGSYDVDPTGANETHRAIEVFPAPSWDRTLRTLGTRRVQARPEGPEGRGAIPAPRAALDARRRRTSAASRRDPAQGTAWIRED